MSKLTRMKTLLAKIETVYGTDPTPTGSANAMLVKNLNVNPVQAELVNRDLVRPYLGNSEQLIAQKFVEAEFEVELVGGGVIGKVPAYDCLLRACGFVGAPTTTPVTIAVTSAVATVTKTAHGLETGDKVIISGCTDTALNLTGATITKLTNNTFTYAAAGAGDTVSAAGTPVLRTGYVYSPVSIGFESTTIYYNVDGILHKITGAMGNFELGVIVKQIPSFKFKFTGLYNAPTDTASPSVDYSGFMIPQVANTANTPAFSLLGYAGYLEEMSLNMANDVQYITLIGNESVKLLDRKPAGTFVVEAPELATKDFFEAAVTQQQGALTITHGSVNGYKVKIDAPYVLLGNPSYKDSNGVQMLSLPYTATPSAGNDEIVLTFK